MLDSGNRTGKLSHPTQSNSENSKAMMIRHPSSADTSPTFNGQTRREDLASSVEALTRAILRAPAPQAHLYIKYFLWLLAESERDGDDDWTPVENEADVRALVAEVLRERNRSQQ